MRVGILGGSFDPPHVGHLALAKAAIDQLELDEVLFVPACRNPLKDTPTAGAKHRMSMVQRMIEKEPKMALSDMEITRGGASYAVDTLDELHMIRPADYWFLAGADAMRRIEEWRNPHRLVRLCRLGVVVRPPMTETDVLAKIAAEYRDKVDLVKMSPTNVSSTDIRERLLNGLPINLFVSQPVSQYIQENRLYRG